MDIFPRRIVGWSAAAVKEPVSVPDAPETALRNATAANTPGGRAG